MLCTLYARDLAFYSFCWHWKESYCDNDSVYAVYYFYPVLCPKLTLIQPTWSAYPYHARTWEESPNIAKRRRKQGAKRRYTGIYAGDFDAIFFITRYWINPYSYSGFLWARRSPWENRGSGLRPSGFTWPVMSAHLTTSYKYG